MLSWDAEVNTSSSTRETKAVSGNLTGRRGLLLQVHIQEFWVHEPRCPHLKFQVLLLSNCVPDLGLADMMVLESNLLLSSANLKCQSAMVLSTFHLPAA